MQNQNRQKEEQKHYKQQPIPDKIDKKDQENQSQPQKSDESLGVLEFQIVNIDQMLTDKVDDLVRNLYFQQQFNKKEKQSKVANQEIIEKNQQTLSNIQQKQNKSSKNPSLQDQDNKPKGDQPALLDKGQMLSEQYKTIQKQQQQEVQFYVYEDLANFTGVLTDVVETIKHFSDLKDQNYLNVAINRLVLQTNLSNAIHFGCQESFGKNPDQLQQYLKEKKNAEKMYTQLMELIGQVKNEKVQECVEKYIENFKEKTHIKTVKALETKQQANFDQKVLDKIFPAMQEIDNKMNLVEQGNYEKLEMLDIQQKLEERRKNARQKLNVNFPKNEGTIQKNLNKENLNELIL